MKRQWKAKLMTALALAAAPSCAASPPPKGVEAEQVSDAAAELEASERALQLALGGPIAEEEAMGQQPSQPSPLPDADPGPRPYFRKSRDRCDIGCDALASMARAARRLCELAGEQHARCLDASRRVTAARETVRRRCPACSS